MKFSNVFEIPLTDIESEDLLTDFSMDGCPEKLIEQLGLVSKSIGLTWNKEVKRIAIE